MNNLSYWEERATEDRRLLMRLLDTRQSLMAALATRRQALARLLERLSALLESHRLGLRLVGSNSPRGDFTIHALDRNHPGFEAGFAESVRVVLRFRRKDFSRLVDGLARRQQKLAAQPWRLLRYLPTTLWALRWRTPSGVLTDPRPILAGSWALLAMLLWRFWPRRQPGKRPA